MPRTTALMTAGLMLGMLLTAVPDRAHARQKMIYGNWCGQGGKGKVIDALDAMCRAHDLCFGRYPKLEITLKGSTYGYCGCDAAARRAMKRPEMVRSLRRQYRGKPAKLTRALATRATFLTAGKVLPCVRRMKRVCVWVPTVTMKRKCTKVLGKKVCRKVPVAGRTRKCKQVPVLGMGGK